MPRTSKRGPLTQREVALKHGFRSGLEDRIAAGLRSLGVAFEFEEHKLKYEQPAKARTYTGDFWLPHRDDIQLPFAKQRGFFVETKGRWLTEDRQKHTFIRAAHPKVDIRFVFSRANDRIGKQSATTYAMYCDRNGWLWANQSIPTAWLRELGYQLT